MYCTKDIVDLIVDDGAQSRATMFNLIMASKVDTSDITITKLASKLFGRHKAVRANITNHTNDVIKVLERIDKIQDLPTETDYSDVILPIGIIKSDYKKLLKAAKQLCQTSNRVHNSITSHDAGILTKNMTPDIDLLLSIGWVHTKLKTNEAGYNIKKATYTSQFVTKKNFAFLKYKGTDLSGIITDVKKQLAHLKQSPGEATLEVILSAVKKVVIEIDKVDMEDVGAKKEIEIYSNQLSRAYLYYKMLVILYSSVIRDTFISTLQMLQTLSEYKLKEESTGDDNDDGEDDDVADDDDAESDDDTE